MYVILRKYILPGHLGMLQLSVTFEEPEHSSPPFAASTFLVLMLVRIPPPHDVEQVPFCHSCHSQSTLHLKIVQF